MEIKASELGVKEIRKVVKILGVHFTHNHSLFCKNEFWNYREVPERIFERLELEKSYFVRESASNQVIHYTKTFVSSISYLDQETEKDFIKKLIVTLFICLER